MPHQTANDLRRLAEGADGSREKDVYFVIKDNVLVPVGEKPARGDFVIVRTEWHGDGLRGGTDALMTLGGQDVPLATDAIFTTQSAFEKFAMPYYARTVSLEELRGKMAEFYEADIIGVGHEPGSVSIGISREPKFFTFDRKGKVTFI